MEYTRIGVKFSRTGMAAFASHLDMQRLFSRAIRRTGLDVKYSEGFNPHIVTSFASAMPVGLKSRGEYMEFSVANPEEGLAEKLNAEMPEGFAVECAGELYRTSPKLMAATWAADYAFDGSEEELAKIDELFERSEILVEKRKKGKLVTADIRPLMIAKKGNIVRLSMTEAGTLSPFVLMDAAGIDVDVERLAILTRIDGRPEPLSALFGRSL